MLELGHAVRSRLELREIAIPYMQKLITKTNETSHLTILNSGKVVYIEIAHPENSLTMSTVIGKRAHLHYTGAGKAIMAYPDRETVQKIIQDHGLPKFTPNTITETDRLFDELSTIRQSGYAVDNMEHGYRIKCIAAPIFNESGQPVASLAFRDRHCTLRIRSKNMRYW